MAKKNVNEKENEPYILPSSNNDLKSFIEKNRLDMMERVVSSIEFAIENKLSIIEVFQFKNSQFVVTVSEKEFESNLEAIFNSYLKDEYYELCPRVSKLHELVKRKNDEKQKASPSSNINRPT